MIDRTEFNGLTYAAYLTDTATGEQRVLWQELPWDDVSLYWWKDGNMGCDCNRGLRFYGQGGEYPCNPGRKRRFTLDLFEFKGHPTQATVSEFDLGVEFNA